MASSSVVATAKLLIGWPGTTWSPAEWVPTAKLPLIQGPPESPPLDWTEVDRKPRKARRSDGSAVKPPTT